MDRPQDNDQYFLCGNDGGNAGPALQTLDQHYPIIESTSELAGRHVLFVNNEYAYLFIRAHQPLRYQREEDN